MLLNLKCLFCGLTYKRLVFTYQDRPPCPKCQGVTERVALPPSVQVEETVDNGLMAKAVTRLSNAEEWSRNRVPKSPIE